MIASAPVLRILHVVPETPAARQSSPLAVGETIRAINGVAVDLNANLAFLLLENRALFGKQQF